MHEALAIEDGFAATGEVLAVADRHDRQGLWRSGDHPVARPSVVGMTMGDHGPVHGADRVDIKVSRRAVETRRPGTEKIFGLDHVWKRQRLKR